jgi:TolB-like protein
MKQTARSNVSYLGKNVFWNALLFPLEIRHSCPSLPLPRLGASLRLLFADCAIDTDRRELTRAGRSVHVEPQVFDLLLHLIANRDRVIGKDELIAAVWCKRAISDSTLGNRINAARHAIGDSGARQLLIRTVARRGFRFIQDVQEASSETLAPTLVESNYIPPASAFAEERRPERLSIAVLAFENMGDDVEQEFFADGIAEEIVTALSRLHWLLVVARNSSFAYKGKSVDVRQIGRELGVRYVLEGSVRKAGNRMRLTAQLIEATTGHQVWAERYERALEDIFAIQDEITRSIIGAISPGIVASEIRHARSKNAPQLGQWARVMRAHWHVRRFTREDCLQAIRLLEEASRHDPHDAMVLADLAYNWHMGGFFGWIEEQLPVALERMGEAARRAVARDDRDATAQTSLALYELFSNRHDDAIRRLKRAIALDPNSSFARGNLGVAYSFGGQPDDSIVALEETKRLSPRDYLMVIWHTAGAWSHLHAERFAEAVESGQEAIDFNPNFPDAHGVMAASAAHLGRVREARSGLEDFMHLLPGLTLRDPRLIRPFRRASDRDRFLHGLRKAGLPE